jgi:RNA polymerase sigma factor (sigma-70 family)
VTEATDRRDLEQLLRRWYAPAYRTAMLVLNDANRAEDAVQEAFLRLWRFRDALPEGDGLRPWIYRVVVNACYSAARGEQRHAGRRSPEQALEEIASGELPEDHLEALDRADAVRRAIRSLPVDLRVTVVLRYYSGLSEREIATAIRRRSGTVKSRLHEARRLLALNDELAQFATDLAINDETKEAT